MLTTIGLAFICIAWLYQFYLIIGKKDKMISRLFVGVYALGVLMLVVDGFISSASPITGLNLVSLIIAIGVLLALLKKQKVENKEENVVSM